MNLLKDICGTFCDGLAMREVPMGYAIRTPFRGADGDPLALYVRRSKENPSLIRLEDDGSTVAALQEEGFALDNEQRFSEFQNLLTEHSVLYDEAEYLVHTEYMGEERAAASFLKFMSLMVRVADLKLLSRDRVRETFKADVQAFVEGAFEGLATVERDVAPLENLGDYIPDVVVRGPQHTLAIYAGTSEVKALEAFVLWQELLRQGVKDIVPVVVFETAKPPQIKARTLSRIMNSDVAMASMEGSKWEVTQKLRQRAGVEQVIH
jgi:hypothetical protein